MASERDEKGRFKKGHSGNPEKMFKVRPEGAGRKPSKFRQILETLKAKYNETMTAEDFRRTVMFLMSMNKNELIDFAKSKDTPVALLVVASAIAGDIENKQLGNLDKLMDRMFGKAIQHTDITSNGKPIQNELTKDQIDKLIDKL